jgi:periplasmic divalent cation tolerance protein
MDSIKILYITCPDKDKAKKIADALLDKKLIACANMFPIESMYEWEGKLNNDNEVVLLLKTTAEKADQVEAEVKNIHPYDTPCILRIGAEANKEYFDWVCTQTKG